MPGVIGRVIEAAKIGDQRTILIATAVIITLGILQSIAGILRHRMAVTNWVVASSRIQQLITRKAVDLGGQLRRDIATGEVVAVASGDVEKIGWSMEVLGRLVGAIVAFLIVAMILLQASTLLGCIALIGIPLLGLIVGPLLRPLEKRESAQRKRLGRAAELATDTVAGLRVLRGIGGEDLFIERFQAASQDVRNAAVDVAKLRSLLEAMQVALPGLFVVAVVWVGAHLAQTGAITVGQLVAFYGYSAFLLMPLRIFMEAAEAGTKAYVSAGRVIRVLSLVRDDQDAPRDSHAPDLTSARLQDPVSGLTIEPGILTAVVCAEQTTADEIALRLSGIDATGLDVLLGDVTLGRIPREELRDVILVQDKDPALLSGTLRQLLDVPGSGRITVAEAIEVASAEDVLDSLVDTSSGGGDPMDAMITERGRSLSGGQRQRLALARSLLADAPILVLDEPTSAVDAHTEARIASNLVSFRAGMTTVVMTSSPLVLDRADTVVLVIDGRVCATGRHRELLHGNPEYRSVITREEVTST
jgi:ABC-type multidrug transport system fused ATPase/permease subunit